MRSKEHTGGNLCNKNLPETLSWRGEDGVIPPWQVHHYEADSNDKRRRSRINKTFT